MSEGQEFGNRPTFINALGDWFASVPDVHERLLAGARMADVGSGGGWTSISLAKAYPRLTVDGFDLDGPAGERARANAEAEGGGDRGRFPGMVPADADPAGGHHLLT